MFPISDSIRSNKFPFITLLIIAANIYVFFLQITAASPDSLILQYALTPSKVDFLNLETLPPFITALFLHGGLFHILSNMWFLWVFGDNVEAHIGKIKYIFLFLLSGLAGNALQYVIFSSSSIPMLGASGAVSGILGSYLVLFPGSKIKTFLVFFFFVSITEIPAVIYIFYWFAIQLFSGIASLPLTFQTGGIAFWAHVGGFIAGLVLARGWKNRGKTDIIEGEIVG